MKNTVFVKHFELPKIDKNEVLRYMGVRVCDETTDTLLEGCIKECEVGDSFGPKACFCICDITNKNHIVDMGVAVIKSDSLSKHLEGCDKIVIFAATVGIAIDRLVEKYSRLLPSKALCFSSIGAQQIEKMCDDFCLWLKNEYDEFELTSRFSPGYGDFDVCFQSEIFKLLDCHKKIGLSLCDSFIMSPSKSVTAIIGLKAKEKI